ncbi:oligosaccharide flippase family protein [Dokdonia sp. LLG6352-1]|uniref:oligosaccharide flippase family protein n=1 Tax=Dokdonia sp. LLG6352-1 TaxID=3160831 RepID=UPI00386E100B
MSILKSIKENAASRKMAGNYVSLLFIQAANILLPLILLPYLVRTLGVEKYGLVLLAQSFCTILYVFVEFGFNLSATRRISILKDNDSGKSQVFSAVISIKLLLAVAVAVVYAIIILAFPRFRLEWEVYALSYGVVVGQALFPDWFFQGIEKMQFIAILNVLAKIIFTALIFIFVREVGDYSNVPLFTSIGFLIAGTISFIISLKFVKLIKPSKKMMGELMTESKSIFVSNIAARLFNSANVFIVGMIAGDAIAGIYGSFERIFMAAKGFFSPIMQAVFPWLSVQDEAKRRASIRKMAPGIIILAGIFITIILIFGEDILQLLFDDPAITAYTTAFKILCTATVFAGLNMLILTLYLPAVGAYVKRMNILLAGGVFNVVLACALVSVWPIYGIVIAVVFTELALALLSWVYFFKQSKPQSYAV